MRRTAIGGGMVQSGRDEAPRKRSRWIVAVIVIVIVAGQKGRVTTTAYGALTN